MYVEPMMLMTEAPSALIALYPIYQSLTLRTPLVPGNLSSATLFVLHSLCYINMAVPGSRVDEDIGSNASIRGRASGGWSVHAVAEADSPNYGVQCAGEETRTCDDVRMRCTVLCFSCHHVFMASCLGENKPSDAVPCHVRYLMAENDASDVRDDTHEVCPVLKRSFVVCSLSHLRHILCDVT